jgi:hypothetical protein
MSTDRDFDGDWLRELSREALAGAAPGFQALATSSVAIAVCVGVFSAFARRR